MKYNKELNNSWCQGWEVISYKYVLEILDNNFLENK